MQREAVMYGALGLRFECDPCNISVVSQSQHEQITVVDCGARYMTACTMVGVSGKHAASIC